MELIKIEKSKGGKDVVDARHLHQVLGIETQFSKWIQRMFEYGFKENVDYAIVKNVYQENQHVSVPEKIDYVLTTDCCKHIAMIQRTTKGMEVRQYFIDYEKNSNKPSYLIEDQIKRAEAWIEEQKEKKALSDTIREIQPKAEYYDTVTQSKSEMSISEASKILGLGYGSITLFKKLREKGVIMKGSRTPYQQYIDNGWFRVVQTKYTSSTFEVKISLKTVVYQKGLDGIRKLLSKYVWGKL